MDRPVRVLRFSLRPVTIGTHNALLAERNHFAMPKLPMRLRDLQGFIWLHHPRYSPSRTRLRALVFRAVKYRLFPIGHQVDDALRRKFPDSRFVRAITGFTVAQRLAAATGEIRRQMLEAIREFPRGSDDQEPLPFSHQAYIMNTMRRTLGMTFEETEKMPLKRLAQHLRELIHHRSNGKAMQMTEEESSILAEYLRQQTLIAQTPEAMAAEAAKIKENSARRMKELGLS